jgi:hypothetical protein
MAVDSVNDRLSDQKCLSKIESSSLLNLRDKLYDELSQATALAVVANSEDFLDFHQIFIRDYLAVLRNSVAAALDTYKLLDDQLGRI